MKRERSRLTIKVNLKRRALIGLGARCIMIRARSAPKAHQAQTHTRLTTALQNTKRNSRRTERRNRNSKIMVRFLVTAPGCVRASPPTGQPKMLSRRSAPSLLHCRRGGCLAGHSGSTVRVSSAVTSCGYLRIQPAPPRLYLREEKTPVHTRTYAHVSAAELFTGNGRLNRGTPSGEPLLSGKGEGPASHTTWRVLNARAE